MKNKIILSIIYIIILLSIVLYEFSNSTIKIETANQKNKNISFSKIDKNFLDYQKIYKIDKSINRLWGIKKEVKKIKKTSPKISKIKENISIKNKTICYNKECFKLIGIVNEQNIYKASFYNKDYKNKYKLLEKEQNLSKEFKIVFINSSKIEIKSSKPKKIWTINLFNIDILKYKPKEIKIR